MSISRVGRKQAIAALVVLAAGACVTSALAAGGSSSGTSQLQMQNVFETSPTSTSSLAWTPLPHSDASITVPAGTTRLVNARFSAESYCDGPGSGWCSVRITAINVSTGTTTELNPAEGTNFAFDSDAAGTGNDQWEAHAMERSARLDAGAYRFRVEYAVVLDTGITFNLDDWHFALESST